MIATFSIPLATEPHSQQWYKILISEYDFAVNAAMSSIHKLFIIHDLVNKLLIAKISPAKNINIFNALIFIKEYADKK